MGVSGERSRSHLVQDLRQVLLDGLVRLGHDRRPDGAHRLLHLRLRVELVPAAVHRPAWSHRPAERPSYISADQLDHTDQQTNPVASAKGVYEAGRLNQTWRSERVPNTRGDPLSPVEFGHDAGQVGGERRAGPGGDGREAEGGAAARVPGGVVVHQRHELVDEVRLVQVRRQRTELLIGGQLAAADTRVELSAPA